MPLTFDLIAPRFDHDCISCAFVGHDGLADVYLHGETVIRRFSCEGADYSAFPIHIAQQVPAYAPAVALCAQHLIKMEIAA